MGEAVIPVKPAGHADFPDLPVYLPLTMFRFV